jgi:hypothetical protein
MGLKTPFDLEDHGTQNDNRSNPFGLEDQEGSKPFVNEYSETAFSLEDQGGGESDVVEPSGDEPKPKLPYYQQAFELLDAPRNYLQKNMQYKLFGDQAEAVDGKYNFDSLLKNAGYDNSDDKSWRDVGNDFVESLIGMDADKTMQAGSDIGKKIARTASGLIYDAGTDPLNYAGGVVAKGLKSGASVLGKAVPYVNNPFGKSAVAAGTYGLGLGLANQESQEKDSETPYIGPLEGASIAAALPLAKFGAGKILQYGDDAVGSMLKNVDGFYNGKRIDLSQYPKLKDAVETRQKDIDYIALQYKQGKLKALQSLDDKSAVKVNEWIVNAKKVENTLTDEAYFGQAMGLFGEKNVNKAYKETFKRMDADLQGARASLLEEYGVTSPDELPVEGLHEYTQIKPDITDVKRKTADSLYEAQDSSNRLKNYAWNNARNTAQKKFIDGDYKEMAKALSAEELRAVEDWKKVDEAWKVQYNKAQSFDEVFTPNINMQFADRVNPPRGMKDPATEIEVSFTPDALKKMEGQNKFKFVSPDGKFNASVAADRRKATPTGVSKKELADQGGVPVAEGSSVFVHPDDVSKIQKAPMVGFGFHQADLYDKRAFEASKKIFNKGDAKTGFKRGVKAGESDAVQRLIDDGVPPREAYERVTSIYADQASKNFLTEVEKEARAIVTQGREASVNMGLGKMSQISDALTSSWKKKVLYLNVSWAKINYWDGVMKTFIERGWGQGFKSARLGGVSTKLAKEIDSVFSGNPSTILDDRAMELIKYDVLGGTRYQELADLTTTEAKLRFSPDSKVYAGDGSVPGQIAAGIRKYTDKGLDAPIIKPIQNVTKTYGQQFEWNARATTYDHIVKMLESKATNAGKEITPELADSIRKEASGAVKDIFYDYGKVKAVEQEIARKYLPFYSFASKNIDYWSGKLIDPQATGRINQVVRGVESLGSSATRDEEYGQSISDENNNMQKGLPRKLKGEDGSITYSVAPKLSMFDALNWMTNPGEAFRQSVSPFIKGAIDMFVTKRESFSGQPMDPAENPFGGKNWVGQKGYAGLMANKIFGSDFTTTPRYTLFDAPDVKASRLAKDSLNLMLGTTGVKANVKTGSPETDSKWTMYNHKIRDMLPIVPPLGGVGTAVNLLNAPVTDMLTQMIYQSTVDDDGKTKPIDWGVKLLTPFDLIKKDEEQMMKKQKKWEGKGKDEVKKFKKDQREREKSED